MPRLLEHDDPEVAPRQRERHGEAADTAPGDDHGRSTIACCDHWNRLCRRSEYYCEQLNCALREYCVSADGEVCQHGNEHECLDDGD